jgi:hypothetical protein
MINLKNILNEVRIINVNKINSEPPIYDNETIRVYYVKKKRWKICTNSRSYKNI